MTGRRKTGLHLGMSRLYEYKGKRASTYYTITPDNRRINLGHDLKAAKRKLLELDGEPIPSGKISELLDDLIGERRRKVEAGKLSKSTLASNLLEVEQLKKAFGKLTPDKIRPMHIYQYLHKYRGAESPIRANREIALFSKLFSGLVSAGVLDINPCMGVERNEEVARDRLVSEREFDAFLLFLREGKTDTSGNRTGSTEARVRVAIAAEIAYLTSKAQGQVLKLMRSQISEEGVRFPGRKRGVRTLVEWTPRLRAIIQEAIEQPARIVPVYVIHNEGGQPYTSDGFKTLWQRAMNEWEEMGNERFTFHDIRAKAVTDVIEQGRKASDLTGHVDDRVIAQVYDRRRERKAKAVK